MNNSELCEKAKKFEDRGEIEKAYQLYLEAAIAEDDGEAMKALADMYMEGDYVNTDYDKAGRYYGLAFEHKADIEPWTLIMAGTYWKNRFDEAGDEEFLEYAVKYFQTAADLGVTFGNECLGELYYELGEYEKAYENLLKADGRNVIGFYYLGRMYDEGRVVSEDRNKAIEYYRKAI